MFSRQSLDHFSLAGVRSAAERLRPYMLLTPLLRSEIIESNHLFLKCENLQRTRSFKYRGALNALLHYKADPYAWDELRSRGVITASSGNLALAMAQATRELEIPYTVLVREDIISVKLTAILRLNPRAEVIRVPGDSWKEIMKGYEVYPSSSIYISGELNAQVVMGIGTMALEFLEQMQSFDTVIVPYGGGALAFAIGSIIRELKPHVQLVIAESAAGSPYYHCSQLNRSGPIPYQQSFVDGIGADFIIHDLFDRVKQLYDFSTRANTSEIKEAVTKLLFYDKLVTEGAGACPVAVYLANHNLQDWGKTVCIVSGGNIDLSTNLLSLRKVEHESHKEHKQQLF